MVSDSAVGLITSICNSAGPTSWPDWNSSKLEQADLKPSLEEFHAWQFFAGNAALMAITLFVWEFAVLLPSEFQLYLCLPKIKPELVLFMLVRYSALSAMVVGGYSVWHKGDAGMGCIQHSQVPTMLVQLAVCSVLAWRAAAAWKYDMRVVVLIGLLLATLLVFSALITMTLSLARLPNGGCILLRGDMDDDFFPVAWLYAGSLLYDAILMVLSISGQVRNSRAARIAPKGCMHIRSQWNCRNNDLWFFVLSTTFNAICFAIGLASESRARALLVLYSAVMCGLCQHTLLSTELQSQTSATGVHVEREADQPEIDGLVLSTFFPSSTLALDTQTAVLPVRAPTPTLNSDDKCCTVLQLHDFQPSEPMTLPSTKVLATLSPPRSRVEARDADRSIEYLCPEARDVPRETEETSELEVADILANMSDDAKSVSLALAGMEDYPLPDRIYEPRYRQSKRRRPHTQWLMHPPLM